jgi:hypothetical protein
MASGDLNMPSLDNLYDLTEKLSDEGMEYVLICIQKGNRESRVDVMLDLKNEDAVIAACSVMNHLSESLAEDIDLDGEEFTLDLISDEEGALSDFSFEFDSSFGEEEEEQGGDDDDDDDDDEDERKNEK